MGVFQIFPSNSSASYNIIMKSSFTALCVLLLSVFVTAEMDGKSIDGYASKQTLIQTAEMIGTMYKKMNFTVPSSLAEFYQNETSFVVRNTVKILDLYDRQLVNFTGNFQRSSGETSDQLEKIFNDSKKNLVTQVNDINRHYEIYKSISKFMETIDGTEVFEFEDIPRLLNNSMAMLHLKKYSLIHELDDLAKLLGSKREMHVMNTVFRDKISNEQSVFFNVYVVVVSTQLKELAMNVFNYHYQYAVEKTIDNRLLNKRIKSKVELTKDEITQTWESMAAMIRVMPTMISKKHPERLERDKNFIELERLFQTVVIPNNGFSYNDSCVGHCSEISYKHEVGSRKEHCLGDKCASCSGRLRQCVRAPSIATCSPKEPRGTRKYEWLQTFNSIPEPEVGYPQPGIPLKGFGPIPSDKELSAIYHKSHFNPTDYCNHGYVDFYRSYRFFLVIACDYCICTCEENTHLSNESTFVISSVPQMSNTTSNRVITGLRFVKRDRIVYPQIKEGKLLAGGMIDQATDEWKDFKTLDRKSVDKSVESAIKSKSPLVFSEFIVIGDESKTVNLDDLPCPSEDYVVTGVSLKRVNDNVNEKRIQLVIYCQQFDFLNGSFVDETIVRMRDRGPHTKILETNKMPPERLNGVFNIESNSSVNNQAIEITESSWNLDAGQSVVPYFDAQSVTGSVSAAPLRGVGLYHRGGSRSGGFLAFRLITIDHTRFI